MAELFESYERRIPQINAKLAEYGISSIESKKDDYLNISCYFKLL